MAMKNFAHLPAGSLKEAAAALSGTNRALAIAGGTDALGALKDKIHKDSPALVVDLKTIPGLSYISEGRSGLRIGALTPLAEIAAHKAVNANYKLLAEAARSVASPQLRNMATIAGNQMLVLPHAGRPVPLPAQRRNALRCAAGREPLPFGIRRR